jgi:putative peptidoglycan lipid II flippase
MIKKIFNSKILNSKPTESVISAAFIIIAAGLVSNVLGLFRDRLLASTFGAGDTLDAYYAAFRIPDLIYNLLILGALSAAFIPVFTGLISKEKDDEAWKMANGIANLAILCIVMLSIFFAIFAPWLMRILTPGFSPEKIGNVVMLTRIMFLSPLFLGISGIMGGILTSMKRFLIYSIAPLLYNLGIIFGILVFVKFFGMAGLAWGVVLGAFLHMLLQYLTARNLGYKHHWEFLSSLKNKEVRKVLRLMVPRMMGIAVNQFNSTIDMFFVTTLAAGSFAIYTFANNLQSVPLYIFGISFSIAVFPTLSAFAAKGEQDKFISSFSETFRQILFFIIPASVFMLVLRAQIVRVVLGAGKFDWNDTILTFECMSILVVGLFAQSATQLLARSFYALHDTKTPFYIALMSEIMHILAVLILIRHFQLLGVMVAITFAGILQMAVLLYYLRKRFSYLDDKNILKSTGKILFASVLAGVGAQIVKYLINAHVNIDTFLGIFTQLAAASIVGVAIFIATCQIIRLEEYMNFKKSITRKILGGKKEILEDFSDVSGI